VLYIRDSGQDGNGSSHTHSSKQQLFVFSPFFIILVDIVCFHYCVNVELHLGCVISSFRHGVGEIFALLGCYAAYIGSYGCLGTTYLSHLQGKGSPRRNWLFSIRTFCSLITSHKTRADIVLKV